MQITDELPWNGDDIAALKAFLSTRTGLRCLPKVLESVPALLASGDINTILVRTGEVRGFSQAVQVLLSLSVAPAKPAAPEPSAYPSLSDDDAWADGQTLTAKHQIPHA